MHEERETTISEERIVQGALEAVLQVKQSVRALDKVAVHAARPH